MYLIDTPLCFFDIRCLLPARYGERRVVAGTAGFPSDQVVTKIHFQVRFAMVEEAVKAASTAEQVCLQLVVVADAVKVIELVTNGQAQAGQAPVFSAGRAARAVGIV